MDFTIVESKNPNRLELLSINTEDDTVREEVLQKLGKKLKVKTQKQNDYVFYQINPTPAQLMSLVKDDYFTGVELIRKRSD